MSPMYDLIVVGAGPAGASAARTAAQHGLKTLLIEKDQVPRNKLCGGGVTPKVLAKLDFKLPDELIECKAKATRMHVGESQYHFEADRTIVYMTSRSKFDAFLADKAVEAGAELRAPNPVYRIQITKSHVEVKTPNGSFSSKILIGADGPLMPSAGAGRLYERGGPSPVG